jgi:hypothetical protein
MLTACLRTMARCLVAGLVVGSGVVEAQNAFLPLDPADGVFDGASLLGTSASVSGRIAVVGGPNISLQDPASIGLPGETFIYQGAVNVYTTDGTAWTLETVLHPEDDAAPDQYFGVGAALRGQRLIVASSGALWSYERRKKGFELTDKLDLPAGDSIPLFTGPQLFFENGVLALKVAEQGAGSVVLIYSVDHNGRLRKVAKLTAPNDSQHVGFLGNISLNRVGDELAIGQPSLDPQTLGKVYFYQPRGNSWHLSGTLASPGLAALGFGTGAALQGQKLVVGAPGEGTYIDTIFNTTVNAGTVHVYRREHDHWVQVQTISGLTAPSFSPGLASFGTKIATNGRFVWIQAPQDPEGCASCQPGGVSNLYEWENGQLVLAAGPLDWTVGGGLDMSRRYVIEGNDEQNFGNYASVIDLTLVAPDAAREDQQPED